MATDPAPHGGEPVLQPILAAVDVPWSTDVIWHNHRLARFRGWMVSTRGREMRARVHAGRRLLRDVGASIDRPDVIEALGPELGDSTDPQIGFECYVDLPKPPWKGPVEFSVTFTDGQLTTPPMTYRFAVDPVLTVETYVADSPVKRSLAQRWLHGRGLEFGALHQPLWVDRDHATVHYADKLTKAEALALFPELEELYEDAIVDPEIIVDLDTDDLTPLASKEFDFFAANDVIEHLANPLRFLKSVHDVMKRGSRFLLSVPDRRFTHDAFRERTTFRHLWREYQRDVTVVDDAHIVDYLTRAEREVIPDDEGARQRLMAQHRERSVHVHVWEQRTFDRMLERAIRRIPLDLEVVDRASPEQATGTCVYVLERR